MLDNPWLHCSGGHQNLALDEMKQEATEGANVVRRLDRPMAVAGCCTRRYSASDVIDEMFELSERSASALALVAGFEPALAVDGEGLWEEVGRRWAVWVFPLEGGLRRNGAKRWTAQLGATKGRIGRLELELSLTADLIVDG